MAFFTAIFRMAFDGSQVAAGLKRVESQAEQTGKSLNSSLGAGLKSTLAGFFSAGAAASAFGGILNNAGKIVDLADAYNLSTLEVQKLNAAAIENGSTMETMAQITAKLSEARKKARDGDNEAIATFGRMGVSLSALKDEQVSNFAILSQIGVSLRDRNDQLKAQSDLYELVGTKAAKSAASIKALNEVEPLIIITDEELKKLDKLGDKLAQILPTLTAAGSKSLVAYFESLKTEGESLTLDNILNLLGSFVGGTRKYPGQEHKPTGGKRALKEIETTDDTDYSAFNGSGYQGAVDKIEEDRKEAAKKTMPRMKRDKMDRADGGSLASIGGLFLGGDYNLRLMEVQKAQVEILREIRTNTKETTTVLKEG